MKIEIDLNEMQLNGLNNRMKDSGFNKLEEYIHFLINSTIENEEFDDDNDDSEEEVREKLKKMGYL
jgi:hypothetical protein